uniref:Uncharacterized protein n=1 Tax=Oryza glumipatula TaxID=40148 RepID=A0A0E0AB32_9ORYZ
METREMRVYEREEHAGIQQIRGQIHRCHRARIATPPPRLSDLASSPAVDREKGVGGERLVATSNAIMGIRCHRSTTIIGIRCLRSQMRGKPVMRGPSTIAARREDEGDKSEVEEKLRSRGSAAAAAEEEATSARWRKRSGVGYDGEAHEGICEAMSMPGQCLQRPENQALVSCNGASTPPEARKQNTKLTGH